MRNKVFIIKSLKAIEQYPADKVAIIDVGKTLAEKYNKEPDIFTKKAEFDSFNYFQNLFESFLSSNCKYVVFHNIGVLCEDEFALNVANFFLDYSKSYETFIVWPFHIVSKQKLTWLPKSPANFICFSDGVLELRGDEDEVF